LGFDTKKTTINSKVLNIQLDLSSGTLEEVVVTGYGVHKSKVSTGTAAVVEEDNTVYNSAGIEERLQGKVSGILIRGAASLTGNQGTPLINIDGENASEETLKNVNPSDIISIDVLKNEKLQHYTEAKAKRCYYSNNKKSLEALTQVKARKIYQKPHSFILI